jgi:Na+/H+ antiporter NhaC
MTLQRTGGVALLILLGVGVYSLAPELRDGHFGLWSLLPAGLTILICFLTHNVILALILGIAAGGVIAGKLNLVTAYLIPSLGTENYAQILLVYLWALGALLGLWNRNGGARHFAETVAKRLVTSRATAKLFAWIMGVLFHQGGTISTVLAGTTVKPVSDKHKVAHEELAYIVDSTASPIATLIPFNVWPIYVAGLLAIPALAEHIPTEEAAIGLFLAAIPFNFYALIAIAMTFLFAFDRLPLFGTSMSKAVKRVEESGALDDPNATPLVSKELTESKLLPGYVPNVLDFLLPMGTLLGMCIVPWLMGDSPKVFEGFASAVVVACTVSFVRGMPLSIVFDAMVEGIKGVTIGAIILGLAVTLASVSGDLGTAQFVIDATVGVLKEVPYILPALLLAVSMIVAFSIGSSWGTYAVMFPLALPLAFAITGNEMFILLCFGALLGGAVFGDQCSPISDTTILSALACGSDLMAHVRTQLPLALIAAGISAVLYTIFGLFLLV